MDLESPPTAHGTEAYWHPLDPRTIRQISSRQVDVSHKKTISRRPALRAEPWSKNLTHVRWR